MKIIVIGTSMSGKTTLVKYFRSSLGILVTEVDEELTRINGGEFPSDVEEKTRVLFPMVARDILERSEIVFFTNTDYFTVDDLRMAKSKGFKIVQLNLSIEKLLERNKNRVEKEGYEDLSKWVEGMLEYQEMIFKEGVVDKVVDADLEVDKIARDILEVIEN